MGDMINMSPLSPPPIPDSEVANVSAKIMVISMIALFFVVVFCFFLSLYARWQLSRSEDPSVVSWRRRTARQGQQGPAPAKRRGLDRDTLQKLPILEYDPKEFKEGLECSVCLSEISIGEKVRLLPKCNHGFHVECIDMWFKSHSTCPLCRNSVISSQNQELQQVVVVDSGSDSDSDLDLDSNSSDDHDHDHEHEHGSVVSNVGEVPSFPTNVLIWGNEVATTSSSSNLHDELVIEIPSDLHDVCLSTPVSRTAFSEEEAKTPVVSRLKSFKRMLSRGKRVAPLASSSNSADIEAV